MEVSYKWRAPRKNNDAAWRRIANGDWLWERPRPKVSDGYVKWNGRGWDIWGPQYSNKWYTRSTYARQVRVA